MSSEKSTICINGHSRTPENTRVTRHGRAICLTCRPNFTTPSVRWEHEQQIRRGLTGVPTRCPCCGELVQLLPLMSGKSYRMADLESGISHAEVCQPLADRIEAGRRRAERIAAQRDGAYVVRRVVA